MEQTWVELRLRNFSIDYSSLMWMLEVIFGVAFRYNCLGLLISAVAS